MLGRIGAPNIDTLFRDVPKGSCGGARSIRAARSSGRTRSRNAHLRALAREENVAAGSVRSSRGAAVPYRHHVPAAVDHLIPARSEFLTSYTPYQPEIAQGPLQYLYEFQTQVAMLDPGMDQVANASLL